MARLSIAYAHPSAEPDAGKPLAVVAQDEHGVAIAGVPQDVEDLARGLGLPSQTFVGWVEARQATVGPFFERGLERGTTVEIGVTDRRWLQRFAQPGYSDTVSFGPITETPGTAEQVAVDTARSLAP